MRPQLDPPPPATTPHGPRARPLTPSSYGRSQLDLENLSADESEALGCQGAVATLRGGDALFVPNCWWHHVHSADDNRHSISLNFWFSPFQTLALPTLPWPLSATLHAQLARAAEGLVVGSLPRTELAARALDELLALLEGAPPPPDDAAKGGAKGAAKGAAKPAAKPAAGGERALSVRHWVARQLSAIYGRQGAARFCRAFLGAARWRQLSRDCFRAPRPRTGLAAGADEAQT